jgi:hypothetical protein
MFIYACKCCVVILAKLMADIAAGAPQLFLITPNREICGMMREVE